jgi:hypothetical protein
MWRKVGGTNSDSFFRSIEFVRFARHSHGGFSKKVGQSRCSNRGSFFDLTVFLTVLKEPKLLKPSIHAGYSLFSHP